MCICGRWYTKFYFFLFPGEFNMKLLNNGLYKVIQLLLSCPNVFLIHQWLHIHGESLAHVMCMPQLFAHAYLRKWALQEKNEY